MLNDSEQDFARKERGTYLKRKDFWDLNPKVLFCEHNFENHAIIKKYIVGDRVQCYKREDFFLYLLFHSYLWK